MAPQQAPAWPITVSPAIDSATSTARCRPRVSSSRSTPAVLVAQHDLEEEHLLAVGLEPEVSGLDDAGVHRPDGDLVHLLLRRSGRTGSAPGRTRAGAAGPAA